jgi:hypothetical protein
MVTNGDLFLMSIYAISYDGTRLWRSERQRLGHGGAGDDRDAHTSSPGPVAPAWSAALNRGWGGACERSEQ